MAKDTGGPAFPVIGAPGAPGDYPGMTLRDWFAGKALIGILTEAGSDCHEDIVAKRAYFIADALLAERVK